VEREFLKLPTKDERWGVTNKPMFDRERRRRTNYFKATLAKRAEVGPRRETATMTPAAINMSMT
jgi:hypothetical protein